MTPSEKLAHEKQINALLLAQNRAVLAENVAALGIINALRAENRELRTRLGVHDERQP